MKLTGLRTAILNACQIVQAATPARSTMPVYLNLKAIADHTGLTLLATDLEIGIRYTLGLEQVKVVEPGEAIIPATKFVAILRESADTEIDLDADARRVIVQTSVSDYEMPSEDPTAFNDIANVTPENGYHELASGDLQRLIHRTAFAAAKEEGKFAMRGVLFDLDDKAAKLVATDGKRLSVSTGTCVWQGATDNPAPSSLVPPKALSLLERILAAGDDTQPVQIWLRANDALFRTANATVYTRLVEGRFPSYRDVIPKKSNAKVTLTVGKFLAAVRQASIMIDDESKRLTFAFTEQNLQLNAEGVTTGKSKVNLALTDYTGPPVTICFDPVYVLEVLKVLHADDVLTLDLIDGQKSAVWRLGADFLYLVVPMV